VEAAERAAFLLCCFRRGEANDPVIYVRAIAMVFEGFPNDIVESVTHPLTGLPGRIDYPPTPKQVKEACDALMKPILERERWERISEEQLAERDRLAQEQKPSFDELAAQCAAKGIFLGKSRPGQPPTIDSVDAVKTRLGITDEQWNALPPTNAKSFWDSLPDVAIHARVKASSMTDRDRMGARFASAAATLGAIISTAAGTVTVTAPPSSDQIKDSIAPCGR